MTADRDPMLPVPYRVRSTRPETHDSATLELEPLKTPLGPALPGQFTMLYRRGVGEVAISLSGAAGRDDGVLVHTIRDVGAVTRSLHAAGPGELIGARGPFGTSWGLDSAAGKDLVFVAGGAGLAPLRPAILAALSQREAYGHVCVVVGARSPEDLLFQDELAWWDAVPEVDLEVTVDHATPSWRGSVGFVTEPLAHLFLDPRRTLAFVCGPEPMMRLSAAVLARKGMRPRDIRVSLERNMKCAVGLCGHCQLGPLLVCRDGPVVDYERAGPLLAVEEL